jgi:hypothetical protein
MQHSAEPVRNKYARYEEPTPWTPELGRLGNHPLLRHMTEVLRDAGAHEHFRAMWDEIDRSLPVNPGLSEERVFAGISGDGKRYMEVYRGVNPGTFGVFVGRTEYIDTQLQLWGGAQRGTENAGGDFVIVWADPQRDRPDVPAELHLRPAEMGTSSAYGEEGNPSSYADEFFPMAHMQQIAGFDTDNFRTSTLDNHHIAGNINVTTLQLD